MIIKKRCKMCGKEIKSLYPKQLDYNYEAHVLACKKKIDIKEVHQNDTQNQND